MNTFRENANVWKAIPLQAWTGLRVLSVFFFYVPPGLTFKNSTWCSLCVECFVRIWEKRLGFAIYVINWLVFITVVESVYSAVRT